MSESNETQPIGSRAASPTGDGATVLVHTPEVRAFVAAVRSRLGDLTEEEREELVGGLDADMSDLVAERGLEALPDPVAYVAELRSAAGFSTEAAAPPGAARQRVMAWLDRGGATWNRWVVAGDHFGLPAFAQSLRPAWWVLRALCATALFTEVFLGQGFVVGFTFERTVIALLAVVVSVQIGRGAWWPGTRLRHSLDLRLAVAVLNVFAVLLLPVMFNRLMAPVDSVIDAGVPVYPNTLMVGQQPVRNIYVYDAQGHPLVGVQLVDQDGRRLAVAGQDEMDYPQTILAPWMNGRTRLYSVFPMPEQAADPETMEPVGEARLQTPPFASLPPVTLSGVQPSELVSPRTAAQKAAAAKAAAAKAAQKKAEARQKALKAERQSARRSGSGG
jgi:hypothetical protein